MEQVTKMVEIYDFIIGVGVVIYLLPVSVFYMRELTANGDVELRRKDSYIVSFDNEVDFGYFFLIFTSENVSFS